MVEEVIAKEMKVAGYGAIMHDGWSKFGTHYVAIFAQYNRQTTQHVGKMKKAVLTPTSVLLAVRPMLNITIDEDKKEKEEEAEDATSFTAEVHAKFSRTSCVPTTWS